MARRVLALHGWAQNKQRFEDMHKQLSKKLLKEANCELIAIDAPFEMSPGARQWWRYPGVEASNFDAVVDGWLNEKPRVTTVEYVGWPESLARIHEAMSSINADGIFGFSQGAVAASMIASVDPMQGCECDFCKGALPPMPRFAILCSGFKEPLPTNFDYPPTKVKLPSLHVWGVKDERIAGERAQRLCDMYDGAETDVHEYTQGNGHLVPQKADDCPVFVRFVKALENNNAISRSGVSDVLQSGISNMCPVCTNTRKLLDDSCPLCCD